VTGQDTVIDLPRLLALIPGEHPAGPDLSQDRTSTSPYQIIKEKRDAARNREKQVRDGTEPDTGDKSDWWKVRDLAIEALAVKSKDLRLACWLIEALVRKEETGFAGLRDGMALLNGLVNQYWDGLHPRPDEEGVSTTVAPINNLNGESGPGVLVYPLTQIPLTAAGDAGPFALCDYQEAAEIEGIADPDRKQARLSQSHCTMSKFESAARRTPPAQIEARVAELTACNDEWLKLGTTLSEKCGNHAPAMSRIRDLITTALGILEPYREKAAPAAEGEKDGATTGDVVDGALAGREQAFREMERVARFFERTEPHSFLSFALRRLVRWGRAPLPELLTELIPEEAPRGSLFKLIGIIEPPKKTEG
jgi:type VI secretion system protein ImpA